MRACAVRWPPNQDARAADVADLTGRPPRQRAEEDRNLGNNEQQI